jgi:chromate transporter
LRCIAVERSRSHYTIFCEENDNEFGIPRHAPTEMREQSGRAQAVDFWGQTRGNIHRLGPLFTFAAYLGAVVEPPPNGVAGAAIALVAIFLPGLLLVCGMLPFWDELRSGQTVQAAMRGANAAVVGILGLALYSQIWTSSVLTSRDFALALGGFLLLTVWKAPPWVVVMLRAAAATLSAAMHSS